MRALFKQNAFVKFIVTAGFLYGSLYLLYNFIIKEYTYYDQKFIGSIIHSVNFLLEFFNFKTFTVLQDRDYQVIGIDGSNGVWVGSNCNAITLFSLFSVFIIAYPGKTKNKLCFIPIGIISIHLLNILRVFALVLIANYAPEFLNFNHTYTFTFLIYSFIFLLWILWVNRFASKNPLAHED